MQLTNVSGRPYYYRIGDGGKYIGPGESHEIDDHMARYLLDVAPEVFHRGVPEPERVIEHAPDRMQRRGRKR
jgi:hypothetical protein